jgi:copper transport protein
LAFRVILFLFISIGISICILTNISIAIAQEESHIPTSYSEAVTSTNDAIVKAILIVSQVAVAGITFNEIFYKSLNYRRNKSERENRGMNNNDLFWSSTQFLKLIVLCTIVIIATSTLLLFLQVFSLEQELGLDIYSIFEITLSTSVGFVWILRICTSVLIIGSAIIYHVLILRINSSKDKKLKNKKLKFTNRKTIISFVFPGIFLLCVLLSLFSDSMIGHSNALSSFTGIAVFTDWGHLVAIAIWIGGLFYISTIILKNHRYSLLQSKEKNNGNLDLERRNENQLILSFLMNFSYVAIIALTVIGITGLYLGRIHLQNIWSLLFTVYGNILIIKISLTLPMIILGKYNQDRIDELSRIRIIRADMQINKNHEYLESSMERTIIKKIKKSIKIESLLGISIITIASFLSVTSPPSLSNINTLESRADDDIATMQVFIYQDYNAFSLLVIILSIIIILVGILNLRKHAAKVKDLKNKN